MLGIQVAGSLTDAVKAAADVVPEFDPNKSLQQLEARDWGEPTYDSFLVTECHRLRRVPLREFTTENLRIMIGQQIGLPFLVPIALELLQRDPFAAGDYYAGDLLAAVLRVKLAFWHGHPELRRQAAEIGERAVSLLQTFEDGRATQEALTEAYELFKRPDAAAA